MISALIGRLAEFVEREPVAARLGPVLLAIVGYLVTRGTIDNQLGELLVAIVVALFGGGALAAARARVTPVASGRHARPEGDE